MSVDRINISNSAIDRAYQSQGKPENRRTADSPQTPAAGSDEISLSDAARNVDRLAQDAEQSNASRLEQVRQAIAKGTYRVSGEDIARKMIELNSK